MLKTEHKSIREKHRASETTKAQKFLKAVTRRQDEVYLRVLVLD